MSDSPEVRSFGRRRARKLTARQSHLFETLYPTVAAAAPGSQYVDYAPAAGDQIAEIAADLIQPQQRTWLEIGFGGGEHLIWQARQNPDVTIVGCEPFIDGLVKVLSTIDEDGLSNIRLHDDDVRPLLRSMPDDCIDRAFILFPDPWPKRRHSKRRLVNPPLLRELARVMRKGAELRIGTDIADYARTILLSLMEVPEFHWVCENPDAWRVRPEDWPRTRYESKAEAAGRRSCYFRMMRR